MRTEGGNSPENEKLGSPMDHINPGETISPKELRKKFPELRRISRKLGKEFRKAEEYDNKLWESNLSEVDVEDGPSEQLMHYFSGMEDPADEIEELP